MGLFSFVGGLLGSSAEKKASKKATAAQVAGLEKGIAEQQRQFDLMRGDFAPYLEEGKQGLAGLGDFVGTNGADAQGSAIEALRQSPIYQSLFRNGEEAVLQNASATGGLRGGNTQRSLADFGADTLMETIQQQLASLGGLAGMGMGSTQAVSNFGQQKANNVSGLLGGIGDARASGYLARGGITSRMWSSAGQFLDQAVQAALGAGAGAGGAPFSLGGFVKGI